MILLHHQESELSRNLYATMPAGVVMVDCSNGIPAYYTGPWPSAYPSVVVDVPAYSSTAPVYTWPDGGLSGTETYIIPAAQEAVRLPESWAAVDAYVAYVTERAAPCE
ncbi:MAG: hypothetical protein AUJ49_00845 [Desulfovibrionaceae bacterium CG1_02_65_16]|nr:MAG: hypothetical protein AUJ49_00845 [Desulfovibrionaceae bacterium CG1_02_65_16]